MKIILTALLFLTAFCSYGQSVVPLRGDTIKIYKVGGNGELVIKNRTRDTAGIGINAGGGLLEFATPTRINDSTITIGPVTIITQEPGSTPGTPSGDTIYIAAAVDTIYLHNMGNLSPAQRVLFAINGDLWASNWGDGLFTKVHFWPDSSMSIDFDTAGFRAYLNIAAGGVTITADNGLHKNTATNVRLGGTFLENTTEDVGNFEFNITGNGVVGGYVVDIINSGVGNALRLDNLSGGAALVASTIGTGYPAEFDLTNAQNNAVSKMVNFFRNSTGTSQLGMGGRIGLQIKDGNGVIADAANIDYAWLLAPTTGNQTGEIRFGGLYLGTNTRWLNTNGGGTESFGTGIGFTSQVGSGGFFGVGTIAGGTFEGGTLGVFALNTSTSPNTSVIGIEIGRQGSAFNGALGEGVMIQWDLHNANGNSFASGYIKHTLIDATVGAEGTDFEFFPATSGFAGKTFTIRGGIQPTYNSVIPVYASNAAALAGGLFAGDHYRNGDADNIVH